jgi:uncharacterized damage-inducible protein DinB
MSVGQKEQNATIGRMIAAELRQEAVATRKMLERVPEASFDWKPHDKSMTLERLAGHIVEMANWTAATLKHDELDFATAGYKPKKYTAASELVEDFDKNVAVAVELLETVSDEEMMQNWRLRNGEQIFFEMPKAAVMRTMVMNHIIHHRGQLAVYLRLLDVPLPPVYGPSADEQPI